MAEWRDIPLLSQSFENSDDVEVDQFQATMMNVIPVMVENKIHGWKRPGLAEHIDLGTGAPVDGLYFLEQTRVALAVSAGRVFKITDAYGAVSELTGSTALLSNAPVKFAGDATRVVMANGGRMVYTDLATLTTMADADAPTAVTHLAALDGYILANVGGSGMMMFSDLNDLTSWQALSFFSAESKPDPVVAIDEGFREIIALGRETVEFWINDGQNPFSRIQGSAQPFGTSAAYSLALVGSTWMWLDHKRRFVSMQGRQVVPVSSPYDRVIQRYQAVDDAVGYATTIDGMPLYVLNFPTAGETLVYNYMSQHWHKWGYWVGAQGLYQRYRGLSYCYATAWNQHLVGDRQNGKVYLAARGVYADAGDPIRSLVRTGHISHGMHADKQSDIVRLHCKRGVASSDVTDPQIILRRRINNRPQWGHERWKSLGQAGQHTPYIDWKRNGIYRTCQYELTHTDNTDLVLMGAQELLTGLG
ncbi:MAG: hypothetical protein OEV77_02575 [Nitrospira sp.]|nr:hypothetical protein [Nitrospira sp.]